MLRGGVRAMMLILALLSWIIFATVLIQVPVSCTFAMTLEGKGKGDQGLTS